MYETDVRFKRLEDLRCAQRVFLQNASCNLRSQGCSTTCICEKAYSVYAHYIGENILFSLTKCLEITSHTFIRIYKKYKNHDLKHCDIRLIYDYYKQLQRKRKESLKAYHTPINVKRAARLHMRTVGSLIMGAGGSLICIYAQKNTARLQCSIRLISIQYFVMSCLMP